jgi:hypothetical protein
MAGPMAALISARGAVPNAALIAAAVAAPTAQPRERAPQGPCIEHAGAGRLGRARKVTSRS